MEIKSSYLALHRAMKPDSILSEIVFSQRKSQNQLGRRISTDGRDRRIDTNYDMHSIDLILPVWCGWWCTTWKLVDGGKVLQEYIQHFAPKLSVGFCLWSSKYWFVTTLDLKYLFAFYILFHIHVNAIDDNMHKHYNLVQKHKKNM